MEDCPVAGATSFHLLSVSAQPQSLQPCCMRPAVAFMCLKVCNTITEEIDPFLARDTVVFKWFFVFCIHCYINPFPVCFDPLWQDIFTFLVFARPSTFTALLMPLLLCWFWSWCVVLLFWYNGCHWFRASAQNKLLIKLLASATPMGVIVCHSI